VGVDHKGELVEVRLGLFGLEAENLLFFLLGVEDEGRLKPHVIVAFHAFYLYSVVVLVVLVFFCEGEVFNQGGVELAVPLVKDGDGDLPYCVGVLPDLF
jgi:hypothetical protein